MTVLGVSKRSPTPTTYYALAFCTHVVAFAVLLIGMFTPYWSHITEQVVGTPATDLEYDRGLIITCTPAGSCAGITNFSALSDISLAAFVLAIIVIVHAFLLLQMFCAGIFIRSCKESNLGIPIATLSILQGTLLMLILVLFEVSLGIDRIPGNTHRNDTFGFSRGLIIGAIILYFIGALFIIGEYMMRSDSMPSVQRTKKEPEQKSRSRPRRSERDQRRDRDRRKNPTAAGAVLPPPYSRPNPVYYPDTEERHYSNANGTRPCKLPGCELCSFVTGSPTFWGPAGVFNISDRLTCQDSKVVYAIICIKDDKVFIGHSQRTLADTFREHLANIKARQINDPVAFHFSREGHSVLDLRVSALARINCDVGTRARLEKALSYDMDRPHNSYYGINDDFEFL